MSLSSSLTLVLFFLMSERLKVFMKKVCCNKFLSGQYDDPTRHILITSSWSYLYQGRYYPSPHDLTDRCRLASSHPPSPPPRGPHAAPFFGSFYLLSIFYIFFLPPWRRCFPWPRSRSRRRPWSVWPGRLPPLWKQVWLLVLMPFLALQGLFCLLLSHI